MNPCNPPKSAHRLMSRPEIQMIGIAKNDLRVQILAIRSRGKMPLTVACVPTGIKTGVSTSPCAV